MTIPKRTIEELKVRLKLEKTVREVYVEGKFDRDLFRWALDHLNLKDVNVYPISTIEVPIDIVEAHNLTSGERQRLITLASVLENDIDIHKQIILIIDSDLDYVLNIDNNKPPLITSDGTCFELILWKDEVLIKFFTMVLGSEDPKKQLKELKEFVEPIVAEIFIFRAAKEFLGMDWKLIDIADTFDKRNKFSFERYCSKIAAKNGSHREIRENLPSALKAIQERADKLDVTKKLHGHDLISAMAKKLSIDGFTQHCLKDFNELSRHLMATLEWAFVKDDAIVKEIDAKFKI